MSNGTSLTWRMLGYFLAKTAIVTIAATISLLILVDGVISGIDERIDRKIDQLKRLAERENFQFGRALDRAVTFDK
jgi:hypothetical protein